LGEWAEEALARALAPTGLSPAKYRLLAELAAAPPGGLPLRELGRRVGRSAPDVTELAVRLERAGLIRRVRAEHDRRIVHATLTPVGRRLLAAATPVAVEAERSLRRLLGEEGWRSLAQAAERMEGGDEGPAAPGGESRRRPVAG
jgi:DNA-binding MarR family transcriptional regulator